MRRPTQAAWQITCAIVSLFVGGCFHSGNRDRCPWPPERRIPAAPGGSERTWTGTSTDGVIEGRLEDFATGAPLRDLTVALVGSRGQGGRSTGSDGEFRFTGVSPGRHVVLVFGRYPNVQDTIVVKPGGGMRGLLRLEPSHPEIECLITVQ